MQNYAVLVVDDDPAVRNSLKLFLEIEGFAVRRLSERRRIADRRRSAEPRLPHHRLQDAWDEWLGTAEKTKKSSDFSAGDYRY